MRATALALAFLALAAPVWAADLLAPDPALSPAEVVAIQLNALQANEAATDTGITQTWAFAHPDNKRMTGPLPRFAQMIKGPQYRMLLNHRSHEVAEVSRTDDDNRAWRHSPAYQPGGRAQGTRACNGLSRRSRAASMPAPG